MPSSVAIAIELTVDERAALESFTRRRTSAQALAQRARIVLTAADGMTNTASSRANSGCTARWSPKWRSRFAEHRVDGLDR